MAMHGINMPLALTGSEYVLQHVLVTEFGMNRSDVASAIAGPAYLPWSRFGNIDRWYI